MKFNKKITLVNGLKTFYWEANPGHYQTIVMLHGFPGNHRVVVDMTKRLGNYHVIIPDLPACGQSDSLQKAHTLDNYTNWLNDFLKIISVNQFILIGYSFGSRVAITFSGIHPEKIKKLILITPVTKADSLIARLASLHYEITERLPLHLQKIWLANRIYHGLSNMIIFKSASKKRRQYLIGIDAKEIKHLDQRANLEIFNELLSSKSLSKGEKINIRTLIIAADKDEIATVSSVKELINRFTNSELKIIKDSGHIVIAERPKRVAMIINEWLKKS